MSVYLCNAYRESFFLILRGIRQSPKPFPRTSANPFLLISKVSGAIGHFFCTISDVNLDLTTRCFSRHDYCQKYMRYMKRNKYSIRDSKEVQSSSFWSPSSSQKSFHDTFSPGNQIYRSKNLTFCSSGSELSVNSHGEFRGHKHEHSIGIPLKKCENQAFQLVFAS